MFRSDLFEFANFDLVSSNEAYRTTLEMASFSVNAENDENTTPGILKQRNIEFFISLLATVSTFLMKSVLLGSETLCYGCSTLLETLTIDRRVNTILSRQFQAYKVLRINGEDVKMRYFVIRRSYTHSNVYIRIHLDDSLIFLTLIHCDPSPCSAPLSYNYHENQDRERKLYKTSRKERESPSELN